MAEVCPNCDYDRLLRIKDIYYCRECDRTTHEPKMAVDLDSEVME